MYASPNDLGLRYDARLLNRLGFDDEGSAHHTGTDYQNSPIILNALTEASGHIDAALSVSHMYNADEMQRLTQNSLSLLARITCDLAMYYLYQRRDAMVPESVLRQREETEKYLDRIRHGDRLFVLNDSEAHQDAGLTGLVAPRSVERVRQNDITIRADGFFPHEHTRINNN